MYIFYDQKIEPNSLFEWVIYFFINYNYFDEHYKSQSFIVVVVVVVI